MALLVHACCVSYGGCVSVSVRWYRCCVGLSSLMWWWWCQLFVCADVVVLVVCPCMLLCCVVAVLWGGDVLVWLCGGGFV